MKRVILGALIASALAGTLLLGMGVASTAHGAQGPGGRAELRESLLDAARAHRRHVRDLQQISGVVASGTGLDADGRAVIRVFLERAGVRGVPAVLDGVRVRTSVSGRIYAYRSATCDTVGDLQCASNETWPLPVPIGVSVGHPDVTAGTIGVRVTDGVNVYALSNNHVLANSNAAQLGDPALQPGAFDGGVSPDDAIGTLADFAPIGFCECSFYWFGFCFGKTCPVNTMDAAIALSSPGELGTSTSTGEYGSAVGYGTPSTSLHPAYGDPEVIGDENVLDLLGTSVQKMGRTTGLTVGTVDTVNATVNVCYDQLCTLEASFDDQIIITPGTFSGGGDSGSLIITNDATRQAVGLLFAGSSAQTIANRVDLVLNRFDVTIDDGGATVPVTDAGIAAVVAPTTHTELVPTTINVQVRNFGNQEIAAGAIEVALVDTAEPSAVVASPLSLDQALAPGATLPVDFAWTPTQTGTHDLSATLSFAGDENPGNDTGGATSNVVPEAVGGPQLQLRQVTASTSAWTTVDLDFDYGTEMVVACSPIYDLATTGPALVRVRNASGSSFEVGVARPWYGALAAENFSIDVHCMAVRAGVYSVAEHGVSMEAVRIDGFTGTDYASSWLGVAQSYLNPAGYASPVVVGQVISADDGLPPSNCPGSICDPVWSSFWSRGASRSSPASASVLYVGRHSGEDPTPRPAGTVSYVVIESGSGVMDGRAYVAALGADTIRGMQNGPPFSYPLSGLTAPTTAIVSQAAMDGGNGGWALLYGSGALSATALQLAIDEDWYLDSERAHTTEQVYYLVFE